MMGVKSGFFGGMDKFSKTSVSAALILGLLFFQGCTTSGRTAKVEIQPAPAIVMIERPIPYDIKIHEKTFVDVFEKRGIARGESTDPNVLRLKLDFNPNVFSMSVTATLSQNGNVIAVGRSHNPGFGTLLARDAAIAGLVAGAATELDSQLEAVVGRLKITASKPATSGADNAYEELVKLEELHRRGVLSDSEFEAAKKRLLTR